MSHPLVTMVLMNTTQLRLLTDDAPWKLDEDTRRIGRAGIDRARAVLADHHRPASELSDDHVAAAEHALAA